MNDNEGVVGTAPTGFTEAVSIEDTSNADDAIIYWKIAGAAESTTVTFNANDPGSDPACMLLEVQGSWESSPVDQTDTNTVASASTYTAGPTGTTSQADEFAVAMFLMRSGGGAIVTSAPSNSYINQTGDYNMAGSETAMGWLIATKVLTATAAQSSAITVSTSQDGTQAIATFKKAADAGIPIAAIRYHHMRQMMRH
jgi:hypothetical protein